MTELSTLFFFNQVGIYRKRIEDDNRNSEASHKLEWLECNFSYIVAKAGSAIFE